MEYIYRFRPINKLTIDELLNQYIWFSRPCEYNDVADSNILSFIKNNESIEEYIKRVFSEHDEFIKKSKCTGICCFTKELPSLVNWKRFPHGPVGIFIEYDKGILEEFFLKKYGFPNCIRDVEYINNPLLFDSFGKHDVVWEIRKDGILYKSLNCIMKDNSLLDKLFLKMFTRINERFKRQKELRIILGGGNIPSYSSKLKGYKIEIPPEAINKIYIHPNVPDETRKLLGDYYYVELKMK